MVLHFACNQEDAEKDLKDIKNLSYKVNQDYIGKHFTSREYEAVVVVGRSDDEWLQAAPKILAAYGVAPVLVTVGSKPPSDIEDLQRY